MAYADGQLSESEVSKVVIHIQECSDCAAVLAETKQLSNQLASWEIEEAPQRIAENVMAALPRHARLTPTRKWVLVFGGACAVIVLLFVIVTPSMLRARESAQAFQQMTVLQGQNPAQPQTSTAIPSGPMVIRNVTLTLITKEFETTRARIDAVGQESKGYVDRLTLRADPGLARTLSATLRVPQTQADFAVSELKKLGRLMQESQNSSDVTTQYVDLSARLLNARNSEQRLLGLLRDRTGNLKDVIEMEREIASVRESIERMEAQQKDLNNKIQFVTIQVELSEEYRAALETPPASSTGSQLRNAAIDGIRSAFDNALDIALFILRYGPVLLIWFAVIGPAAILLWRRRGIRIQ